MQGEKVICAEEMARIEKLAYAQGASELEFMENAGLGIAEKTEAFIAARKLKKRITLLVGKGNNGGDAFAAGKRLIAKGFSVSAVSVFPASESSPLNQIQRKEFEKAGGKVSENVPLEGVILDGLVGTGFRGKAEGELAIAIKKANQTGLPILAIDIPSGLSGTTGEVGSVAIRATQTIYLGLPKLGFYIGQGWNCVGELTRVDFGLPKKWILEAKAEAFLVADEKVRELLPPIKRNRHKYQAGYVVAVAGSRGFSGAAFLSTLAALRAGAGIVRLFHTKNMEAELGAAPLEVVKEELTANGHLRILQECERAQAALIGPGMGRSAASKQLLKTLFPRLKIPCVLDADALFFLAESPKWEIPQNTILTPHRKEAERILQLERPKDEQELHTLCQAYVDKKNATLLLKGGPTFIFHPKSVPLISTHGDPGMAHAGTGDVLTGILAALLAQGLSPQNAAAVGAVLHGLSGEIAAAQKGPYSLIASDLIDVLPEAFLKVRNLASRA